MRDICNINLVIRNGYAKHCDRVLSKILPGLTIRDVQSDKHLRGDGEISALRRFRVDGITRLRLS
jgi:hypothetical protein